APPLRHARLHALTAPPPSIRTGPRTPAHPALGRPRLLPPRARRPAPAPALQFGHGPSRRAHRPAPHDHGRFGHSVVARAVAVARATPGPLPVTDAVSLRGGPAHGRRVDLHLHGGERAVSLLRGGAAHLADPHPARRPAPGRAHHVDSRRPGLPPRHQRGVLPLASRGRRRRGGGPPRSLAWGGGRARAGRGAPSPLRSRL